MSNIFDTSELKNSLSLNEKAICIDNSNWEVFCNKKGVLYQVDDLGISQNFQEEIYKNRKWVIEKR